MVRSPTPDSTTSFTSPTGRSSVSRTPDPSPVSRAVAIGSLFLDRDWPLDVVVYTPEEIDHDRRTFGNLLTMIEADARTLYEEAAGVRS